MEPKTQKAALAHWHRAAIAVIAATRRDQDLTQQELADKVGWTRGAVADLETGRRKFEFAEFIVLAKAFRIQPEVMFERVLSWHGRR